jgi:kinetochore protein Nuf2
MFKTKDVQISVVQTVEFLKSEKSAFLKRKVCHSLTFFNWFQPLSAEQENLNNEIAMVADAIQRSRSRIVQLSERINRTISTMSTTVLKEKRTVAIHDAKARDLQTKINGILSTERSEDSHLEVLCL